jgi:hypothetical protein
MLRTQEVTLGSMPQTPLFMRGMSATQVAFSRSYPPLIHYLTEKSLFKKCPPTGKSLKKALLVGGTWGPLVRHGTWVPCISRWDLGTVSRWYLGIN